MKNLWCCVMTMAITIVVSAAEVRLGTAAVDITPLPGTPMAGYYFERLAQGVHDPLFAKAMVLESKGQRVALVQVDLISTTRWFVEDARGEIAQSAGIPETNILISATHAHTGPVLSRVSARFNTQGGTNRLAVDYTAKLPRLIAQAVRQASENMRSVKVFAGIGREENLAFNRRYFMRDGTVGWNPGKLNPNIVRPAGPTDSEVPVVSFEGDDGTPVACYANFSMHLDTIGGNFFSSDAAGVVAQLLLEGRKPDFFTLYHTGACGDVNHVNVGTKRPQQGTEEPVRIGTILAANILKTLDTGTHFITNTTIRVRSAIVQLPLPKIEPGEIEKARETTAKPGGQSGSNRQAFLDLVKAFKVLEVAARDGKPLEVEVQVIALGNELAWVGLPGEIFSQLGLAIKQSSPFRQTMIAELANGSIGYIPNRVAYTQGNYEVISARCAEGSGEILVETADRLLREIWTE